MRRGDRTREEGTRGAGGTTASDVGKRPDASVPAPLAALTLLMVADAVPGGRLACVMLDGSRWPGLETFRLDGGLPVKLQDADAALGLSDASEAFDLAIAVGAPPEGSVRDLGAVLAAVQRTSCGGVLHLVREPLAHPHGTARMNALAAAYAALGFAQETLWTAGPWNALHARCRGQPLAWMPVRLRLYRDLATAIGSGSDVTALRAELIAARQAQERLLERAAEILPAPPRDLDEVARRLAEQAHEIAWARGSRAHRLAVRLGRTRAWRGARWLRNRNRFVVEVRALGEANPSAAGCEVWVLSAGDTSTPHATPWSFVDRDASWQDRSAADGAYGTSLVSSCGRLFAAVGDDPVLQFRRHPGGGRVEIRFRGRRRVCDLYAAEPGTLTVRMVGNDRMLARASEAMSSDRRCTASDGRVSDDDAFITRARQARAVAVYCPRWAGVSNATRNLFEVAYPVPSRPDVPPEDLDDEALEHHVGVLAATGTRHVVVSGGDEVHLRLVERLAVRVPQLRVDLLWHGSPLQFSEDHEWRLMQLWLDAARRGVVRRIGTVKAGVERLFGALGIPSCLVLNYVAGVPLPPPDVPDDEWHVGVWLSGLGYRKLPHVMLSALAMLPRVRLHAAGIGVQAIEVARRLGVPLGAVQETPLPSAAMTEAIRRTHLSLYVTFSECCPMLPLESLHAGVPALVGPTSHLFQDDRYLADRLVVPFPDRADVIADAAARAIVQRREIVTAYAGYAVRYGAEARRSVEAFLAD